MNPLIGDTDPDNSHEGGHVVRVIWCFRVGGMCIGNYTNDEPDRLLVKYGMDPGNTNSRVDCIDMQFTFDAKKERKPSMCAECSRSRTQPDKLGF
jgi:hypothetical protein